MDDPLRPSRAEIFDKRGEQDPAAVMLDEKNAEAAHVYMLARNQVVTNGMAIVDISIPAVKIAMDLYVVKDQRDCLNRVRRLFYHFLQEKADAS
jgi:hypothetical protein